jgi:glutaredoxin
MAHAILVYSRKGCHLCDVVKQTLLRLQRSAEFTWKEVDIDSDPTLREKYNEEVPVVFIDGRKAFKYQLDERDFLRRISQ